MPYPMKPTELKKRQGNLGKRPLPDPILIGGRMELADLLEPPEGMNADGAKMWVELAPQLIRAGVLDRADVFMFEELCLAWSRLKQYQRVISSEGLFSMGSRDQIRSAPWVTGERAARDQFQQLAARFGLSPVDRARLGLASVTGLRMAVELEHALGFEESDADVIDGEAFDEPGIPGLPAA